MKCLETRRRNGMKWRRYRTEDGARWIIYEVPASVISLIGRRRLTEELERAELGISEALARRIYQPHRKD